MQNKNSEINQDENTYISNRNQRINPISNPLKNIHFQL